jgi:hypothetical protein
VLELLELIQQEKSHGGLFRRSSRNSQPRRRGQQLKDPAQLDGWLRDGSAVHVESLCDWR